MAHLQHFSFLVSLFVPILLQSATVSAQQTPPAIEWQKSLGGSGNDVATSIAQTSDGGYIIAGYSRSTNGDVIGSHGTSDNSDSWIVKLTSSGQLEWQKSLGGSGEDFAFSIAPTSDGGYIVAGVSNSNNGDVTGNHGQSDYWIVKLTSTGEIEWQKSLGGSRNDVAISIAPTSDEGYIVAGWSSSKDGDVTGNHGASDNSDYWIVKLRSSGELEWQKSLGGSGADEAYSIAPTSDGGYIVAGYSSSADGNVTGHHGPFDNSDYWIVKLRSSGELEWEQSLGGSRFDYARSIAPTSDGGYIVAGYSSSADSNVTGHHGASDNSDYWIVKLRSSGELEWQKSLGGSGEDLAYSIAPTSDGGYIVTGESNSTDSDVTGNHGIYDYWIVKLRSSGELEWQKSLGGSNNDNANFIAPTSDGGYIVAGYSASTDGDVTGNHGKYDYWIVKLAPATSAVNLQPELMANMTAISIIPNPAHNTAVLKITSDAEAEHTIELVSSIGEVVKRQIVHLGMGEQEVELREMESLPSGSYEVLVRRGSSSVVRGRFVVVGK